MTILMEAEESQVASLKESSMLSASENSSTYFKTSSVDCVSYTSKDALKPMITSTAVEVVVNQQGDHTCSECDRNVIPESGSLHVSSEMSIHSMTTKSESDRPQHNVQPSNYGADNFISCASLSRSTSYVSSSTTNQQRKGASNQLAECAMSYCEQLRKRLERNRNPRNPHLLEGESIHDRIDAALNPDWHMVIKRYNTQQGQLQYDCDHLRIISGLDMVSAENCYLTNKGAALADVQSMARRMEYGSIDPITCITGQQCSPDFSAYKTFQRLTTPQTLRTTKAFKN